MQTRKRHKQHRTRALAGRGYGAYSRIHDNGSKCSIADRARFVNKLGARSPWKQSNKEAFEAIDKLIEIGWPPMNTKERKRKWRTHRWFESRESELALSAF